MTSLTAWLGMFRTEIPGSADFPMGAVDSIGVVANLMEGLDGHLFWLVGCC